MGHGKLESYFLLSNAVEKPSRLATNVNKHQEFMWKLEGYIIQFYFLNKLPVWEPGYNFKEGSNSPLHGPDWTHFNEKMPVHWNWLIPHVFLFPVRYVYLWAFPPRLLEKRDTASNKRCSCGIQRPVLGHRAGCHRTLLEDLQSPGVCADCQPQGCTTLSPAHCQQKQTFWKLPAFHLHPLICCCSSRQTLLIVQASFSL